MLDQTNLGVMLKNKNLLKDKAYINGNWVDAKSGKTFEVVNPSDGNLIVNVPDLCSCSNWDSLWKKAKSWSCNGN